MASATFPQANAPEFPEQLTQVYLIPARGGFGARFEKVGQGLDCTYLLGYNKSDTEPFGVSLVRLYTHSVGAYLPGLAVQQKRLGQRAYGDRGIIMAVKISPAEYAEKHARRLKASVDDIRQGVERVTDSPTAKAAASADKMLANLSEAVRSGKWSKGLRRVTLEEWKSKTLTKGVGRIAAGIDAAHDKQVDFATELFAHENALMSKIDGMPDLTLEDSVSRATEWIRGMAKFERK